MLSQLLLKYRLELVGILLGAAAGWAYWYFIGCMSGTCMITSRPLNSTLYGALMGMLLLGIFRKEQREEK